MPDVPRERFTAAPWAVWFTVMAVVVTSTDNVVVLLVALAGCWLAIWATAGPRAVLGRLVVGSTLALAAIWVLLGVLVHRDGLGGQVVWLLPSWSVESSGEFGGAVTSGQLHLALAHWCRSATVVAMLGLLAQSVSALEWLRLAEPVWGRARGVWAPLLCLGEAYSLQRFERESTVRAGFAVPGPGSVLLDVTGHARSMSDAWSATVATSRPIGRGVVGATCLIALTVWWALSAIGTGAVLEITGLERTAVALGALGVIGILLHRDPPPRPTSSDAVPLVSGALVAAAWLLRDRTGDGVALVVQWGHLPSVPLFLVMSLVSLPLLSLAAGGRR